MITKEKVLSWINGIIPKKNLILFESYPDYSDNSYALYEYIINNRKDILERYKIAWALKGNLKIKPSKLVSDYSFSVEKKSIKGLWTFLRAKYVISTHGYFGNVRAKNGQVQINLWHGCGYKGLTSVDHFYRGDYTIVTSELFRTLHSDMFEMPKENVWVTGFPRNDALFKQEDVFSKLGIEIKNYNSVYMWMPTYRKASVGHDGVDGNIDSFGIATISSDQYKELNRKLEEEKILLIIKPHPMDALALKKMEAFSHIKYYTNQDLADRGVILYELLGQVTGLLSDYSSTVIDYLILEKPVVFVLSDMKEYQENRGFHLNPVREYMPGPIISDFKDLLRYFSECKKINYEWSKRRAAIAKVFHTNKDNNSCKRVCDCIWR